MVIAFAIIALIIISGLAVGVYGIFIPFLSNLSQIQAYNTAYYGAIASIERALLVARIQEFGYNGAGGRDHSGLVGGSESDDNPGNMGVLSQPENGMRREMQGTTDRIPRHGTSNIPTLFQTADNSTYNAMQYYETLAIQSTTKESTHQNSYTSAAIVVNQGNFINTHRRIPTILGGEICTVCDDEIIILRQRKGKYDENDFTILPNTERNRATNSLGDDTHIRASIINNINNTMPIISFTNTLNPLASKPTLNIVEHNGGGLGFDGVKELSFSQIRQQSQNTTLLYNIVQKAKNNDGFMYPFLEYYIESDQPISNTHRDITGHGKINPYHVQVHIQKPQSNNQKGGSFSIIF